MNRPIVLAAVGALLGAAGFASAAQPIVSGALQTGDDTAGACYVRNVGRAPITVRVALLENFSAGFIAPDVDTCDSEAPLGPGRTCAVLANTLPADVTFECSATAVSGSTKNLRASAELRFVDRDGLVFAAAQDLR